jgi:hypothetical protein
MSAVVRRGDVPTILIVDDDSTDLAVMGDRLEQSGFAVVVASEGAEALERAHLARPDLILLDVMMPGMDGFTVCRHLKKSEATREIPVIFMSSLAETADKVAGFAAGGVDYVTKPFEIEEVLARVRTHLALRAMGRRLDEQNIRLGEEIAVRQQVETELEGLRAEVAERRRTESVLRASQERYRALFLDNPSMYFTLRAGATIVSVNPFGAAQLGYTVEELEGRSILEVFHEADREAVSRQLKECLETPGQIHNWALRKLRKDGTPVWVEEFAQAVDGPDRELNILLVCHDITARRYAEEERSRLREQLEQAQKLEGIGRLAGGVAHDFNNLLTVINGYSDLLVVSMDPSNPLRSHAAEIKKAGERAAVLTRQLLAFSRRQMIEPRALRTDDVVADAEKMLQRLVGDDIKLVSRRNALLGQVMADPVQIQQILMNLVVNARDAMPNGGRVVIETASVEVDEKYCASQQDIARGMTPGPYVLLSVTDTGVGMDESTQRRIFEPFFTTKAKGIGTGLGLSTVYGIVRQAGGSIRVNSEPGKGARFRIYLPRLPDDTQAEGPALAAPADLGGSETVLVVEDQEDVRHLAVTALTTYGYKVLEAKDGNDALHLVEHYPNAIHLMLTDIVMPGMTGRELAGRIRALRPDITVLCMSGYTEDAMTKWGVLESGVAFISKPFTPHMLAARLREILAGVQSSGKLVVN